MAEPLLEVRGLVKRFGGLRATDDLSLEVRPGELHALIGPNGAGKTTAIAQITGELRPDAGRVILGGRDVTALSAPRRVRLGLARTFQVTQLLDDESAERNASLAAQSMAGHSFRFWGDVGRDPRLLGPARAALARAGLPPGRWGVPAAALAHGERKQLELAAALALRPRLLLLDEPMAGLGADGSRRMTEALAAMKGGVSVLLVEHDMDAVFALADRVSVLVGGRCVATGAPAAIRADPAVRAAYLSEEDGV